MGKANGNRIAIATDSIWALDRANVQKLKTTINGVPGGLAVKGFSVVNAVAWVQLLVQEPLYATSTAKNKIKVKKLKNKNHYIRRAGFIHLFQTTHHGWVRFVLGTVLVVRILEIKCGVCSEAARNWETRNPRYPGSQKYCSRR